MEEFAKMWGPVVPVAAALGIMIRWLLKHVTTLTNNNKALVENHINHSTEAINENTTATKELITWLKDDRK